MRHQKRCLPTGEPHNTTDPLFNPTLVMRVQETPEGPLASFDFLLATQR